jgi:Raf kinase inhibitor-like YbhB/YbcL family protein
MNPSTPLQTPFRKVKFVMSRQRFIHAAAVLTAAACLVVTAGCGGRSGSDSVATSSASTSGRTAGSPSDHPDPYMYLPKVPSFTLTSETVKDGRPLAKDQLSGIFKVPGGNDTSPQLSWSGFPSGTKSFVVSMIDPQAPTGFGPWVHWVVADIQATTTSLPLGAGVVDSKLLPPGAFQLNADAGTPRYIGGAPPAGSGAHDFTITVLALDVPKTGLTSTSSAALLGFTMTSHTLARATIICPTAAA